jgi:hypothetical protein
LVQQILGLESDSPRYPLVLADQEHYTREFLRTWDHCLLTCWYP